MFGGSDDEETVLGCKVHDFGSKIDVRDLPEVLGDDLLIEIVVDALFFSLLALEQVLEVLKFLHGIPLDRLLLGDVGCHLNPLHMLNVVADRPRLPSL